MAKKGIKLVCMCLFLIVFHAKCLTFEKKRDDVIITVLNVCVERYKLGKM